MWRWWGRALSISRWAVNKKGDTCVKSLAGNASEVTFSELLGTGVYKASPDQTFVFRGGKLDAQDCPQRRMRLSAHSASDAHRGTARPRRRRRSAKGC